MNAFSIKSLLLICTLSFTAQLRADTQLFTREGDWDAKVALMPPPVQKLVLSIESMDMHPYLLSEFKNHRVFVMRVNILEDSLVMINIEEGHASENVVFDLNEAGGWTIIRRSPKGDWKPQEQRKGDRLTQISFRTEAGVSQPTTQKP